MSSVCNGPLLMNLHAHYHVSKFDQRHSGHIIVIGDWSLNKNLLLLISISVNAIYKKVCQVKLIISEKDNDRSVSNTYNKQLVAVCCAWWVSVHASVRSN